MSLKFLAETDEFKRLRDVLDRGEKGIVVSGVVDAAKTLFLATLLSNTQKKVIFIRPSSLSLSNFLEQCRFYLSRFSNDFLLSILPPLSENPYQEVPPSLESVSSRMKFFYDLTYSEPRLIVTNLFGFLKPFPHPERLAFFFTDVEVGQRLGRDSLLAILSRYGYTQEDIINSHGEFSWRGGIVDVFSPWEAFPFRIELSGEEIVSLRTFDPSSQRSKTKIDRLIFPSLREFAGTPDLLEEWTRLARQKEEKPYSKDLREKAERLKKGDVFPSFSFLSLLHREHFCSYQSYLKDYVFVIDNIDDVAKDWEETYSGLQEQYNECSAQGKYALPPEEIYPPTLWDQIKEDAVQLNELVPYNNKQAFHFPFQSVTRFANKIPFFLKYMKKLQKQRERSYVFLANAGVRQKFASLLSQHMIPHVEASDPFTASREGEVSLLIGDLQRGFRYPSERIAYFSEKDIFTEEKVLISRPRVRAFISHFQDLKAGDFVVHTDYGIGIFKGLIKLSIDEKKREFIEIHYRDDDKLFVPVEDLNLVQKYAKLGTSAPVLNKLGTPQWEKIKARTKKAIETMAKELLDLYAKRKALKGYSYSQEGEWLSDFEKTFEFSETEDQLRTIQEIMGDMESQSPMDRLLCGDVGYGKTEVAMRASFKAVMDGKQVVVLCPTTVLASQHHKTFQTRMVLFPVRVENLTRLQTPAKQKKILEEVKNGLVDIVIGTHRLLSKDVEFRDLGLLIVDEEQRFGVGHKEKIKTMRSNIDVLTMTATPIPRTLNLSLSGLRDISLIETAPKDRLAIHTVVTTFSRSLIVSAIKMELGRGGQVYFIHNKIDDIDSIARMIEQWVPQAKVVTIHGQTPSTQLERRMVNFIEQKSNVLVSTTIIENGIDIPLVNTLIVNRADRFGLAQLYQLRGRVGRSSRQAVAYFLVPPFTELTSVAKERLKALQEFSELGSGFRLAAKDLEIRGAGNFLGSEQHGYMEAVGFNYYMNLLEKTINELKGEEQEEVKSEINMKLDMRIPERYLPQINLRLNLYKRISSVESLEELNMIKEEIHDRYGPLPPGVINLLRYGTIKYLAQRIKIQGIDRIGRKIIIKFLPSSTADIARMTGLFEKYPGSITPQGIMSIKLSSDGETQILHETISILKELSQV
ncbi:MAG: transcription-repair coupling factor [Candidatus Aminicenantes bacterium]|nr:transcription-repair coupling factor [Candidatus Aminicenantes bacterium]